MEKELKELLERFRLESILIIKGVISKINLTNSNIIKTVEVTVTRNKFELFLEDYATYIDKGRRKGTKRVPISALIIWMKRKGITSPKLSTNQLAFAIQQSIYKNGIKARPFINQVINTLEQKFNILLDKVFDNITKGVEEELLK